MNNIDTSKEGLKDEFLLSINDFGTTDSYNKLIGLAKLIQTLFLLKPGTYPNHPNMGIGIDNYKFEYLDQITLSEIQSNAVDQISKYINCEEVRDIKITGEVNKLNGKKNTINVKVYLTNSVDNVTDFILSFEQSINKGKVISKLYI